MNKPLFLTTTSYKRIPLLISTLTSVMREVTNALFVVQTYSQIDATVTFWLNTAADATSNKIHIVKLPDNMSVAYSKWYGLEPLDWDKFINLDDDLLLAPNSIQYLLKDGIQTLGVVDAVNTRGFADYDFTLYQSVEQYLQEKGESAYGKVKHHRFNVVASLPQYKWISQLYSLPRNVWSAPDIKEPIHAAFLQKGLRGYDVMLEKLLVERGDNITLTVGKEAIHLGMEEGLLGNNWKSLHDKDHYHVS